MPGFTTHYIMGMKAFNDMPNNQLKFIIAKHRWLYQLGLQGPDMFFYNIPILRHRDYRNVGSYMHDHCVNDFFRNYLAIIEELESRQQREQAISFFAGFLCHYIGDSICHPFVYGRIHYNTKSPSAYTHGLHAALENDIDAILLKKYKSKKPSQFNQAATICLNGMETQFISKILSRCINETYYPLNHQNNFQVTPAMVHRSILAMRFGCRTLADPTGKKQNKVMFVENIFLKNPVASHKLVTDIVKDPAKSLNLKHEPWINPWNSKLASQSSFPDLFKQSLKKCNDVYYRLNTCISTSREMTEEHCASLLNELGNYSYHSGLEAAE